RSAEPRLVSVHAGPAATDRSASGRSLRPLPGLAGQHATAGQALRQPGADSAQVARLQATTPGPAPRTGAGLPEQRKPETRRQAADRPAQGVSGLSRSDLRLSAAGKGDG